MSPKLFLKGAWPGLRDPLNFWALNANASKTVKAADFEFEMHVSTDRLKNFAKSGRL